MSALALSSSFTMGREPFVQAWWSGVWPPLSGFSMSAFACRRALTAFTLPRPAAMISGVSQPIPPLALTSASYSTKIFTAATLPSDFAALCIGMRPMMSTASLPLEATPANSNSSTIGASPSWHISRSVAAFAPVGGGQRNFRKYLAAVVMHCSVEAFTSGSAKSPRIAQSWCIVGKRMDSASCGCLRKTVANISPSGPYITGSSCAGMKSTGPRRRPERRIGLPSMRSSIRCTEG
mmetsp:Transcript_132149/g.341971  ORF Transcript_132149/g.341971 Transcript_132149/m.341971 type:complete len:236 (-) Transcript_132149:493-1200(-)